MNKYSHLDTIKPDFSEANKFAALNRGFRDEFNRAYNNFWRRRNMKAPDTSWFGERKKREEEKK
jgi:hypothetical protein